MATCGSAKKKQGSKKKTAINMVSMKMIIAQTAKILPAINCIVDIFFHDNHDITTHRLLRGKLC
jgi:hypothetical protein